MCGVHSSRSSSAPQDDDVHVVGGGIRKKIRSSMILVGLKCHKEDVFGETIHRNIDT